MKKKIAQKQLQYFDVKLETFLPATLTYRILSETPEQALEIAKTRAPNGVNYKLNGRQDKKVSVFRSGSNIMLFMKNLFGKF